MPKDRARLLARLRLAGGRDHVAALLGGYQPDPAVGVAEHADSSSRSWRAVEAQRGLQNHGRQVATSSRIDGPSLHQDITWFDERDRPQITEERTTRGAALGPSGWALQWTSRLTASHGDLTIESPATQGRVGAGYGGIFWRCQRRLNFHPVLPFET